MKKSKVTVSANINKAAMSTQKSGTMQGGEHPLGRLTQEQIERHNKQPTNYTYK